ncbi:hypothetical protein SHJG_1580 [Streptomyces hygroscopicus subsp. jinggangensis 5008]|nr:hypothetical protein SHJG_1580 [Streptomyces hygroscopicus subsp. jinggangensis 5008]
MARSWTRLHEHLGAAPGPLDFDMVAKAAAGRLAESDDLGWKEQLPQSPREGRWNELAKDVAAMANTRGGLIIFGVRDTTCELVGIDPDEVNIEQYAQWVRNHVQPYLPDLTFTTLTSADGTTSVLVADVPASPMAPTSSTAPPPATRTGRRDHEPGPPVGRFRAAKPGLAHPKVCLNRRNVRSVSKRRRKDCQQRATSVSVALVRGHHSQTGLLTPPLGSFSTTRRMTVPSLRGRGPSWSSQAARRVSRGYSRSHARAVAFP